MDFEKAIKVAFASEFSFYLKAHNFHWNVEGASFPQLHSLFEKIYTEVYESIDDFAEKIRALDLYAPASLQKFSLLSTVEDENNILSERDMVEMLYIDSEKMADIFRVTYKLSEELGHPGLSNFLAERQDAHKKHCWMLRATLK